MISIHSTLRDFLKPQVYEPVPQSYAVMANSGGPLDNQTWQTEWKTAPLAKVLLCEYENQTLEVFASARHLFPKFGLSIGPP